MSGVPYDPAFIANPDDFIVSIDSDAIIEDVKVASVVNPPAVSAAKISVQPVGLSPDNSGKSAVQYGALIGSSDATFSTLYDAQRALIEASSAQGYNNLVFTSNGPGSCTLLAW